MEASTCFVIVKSIKRQSLVQNQDKTDHSQERQTKSMKEQRLTNSILREDIFGDECDQEWQKAKSA